MPPQNRPQLKLVRDQEPSTQEDRFRGLKTRDYFRTKQRTENRDAEIRRSIRSINTPRGYLQDGTGEEVSMKQKLAGKAVYGAGKVVGKINPAGGAAISAAGTAISTVANPLKAAKEKFGETTVYLMIGTALFFDILIAVIGILDLVTFGLATLLFGSLFDLMALMTFALWFKLKGATFGRRRVGSLAFGFIAKAIPLITFLPNWTAAIFLSFFQEGLEAAAKSAVPMAPGTR